MSFRSDLPFYSPYGLYPALTRRIVELATPAMVLKQLLIDVPLDSGSSVEIPREAGSRTVMMRETAEGAEIAFDTTPYDKVTAIPVKFGIADYVTRELLEDAEPLIPIVETKIRRLARRFAYTVEKQIQLVIEAGYGSSENATGKSLFYTGQEVTLSGTIGQYDITKAIANIEANNLVPEYLLISPTRKLDIVRLPHFSSSMHYGEAVNMTGAIGEIYGLTVLVSTVIPDNRAYVVAAGQNPSAAWEPLGFLVWKRPLTVEVDYDKATQRHNIYVTTRFVPVITSTKSICRIVIS